MSFEILKTLLKLQKYRKLSWLNQIFTESHKDFHTMTYKNGTNSPGHLSVKVLPV
jgi:hypothetical protein